MNTDSVLPTPWREVAARFTVDGDRMFLSSVQIPVPPASPCRAQIAIGQPGEESVILDSEIAVRGIVVSMELPLKPVYIVGPSPRVSVRFVP